MKPSPSDTDLGPLRLAPSAGAWALLLVALTSACEVYDPPPTAALGEIKSDGGKILATTPIPIVFSEPIEPSSLAFTIVPDEPDLEGEIRPDVHPIVAGCTLATSPCDGLVLTLDPGGTVATIHQNGALAAFEGRPLLLQVHAGLADLAGRQRRVTTTFKLLVSPLRGSAPVDLTLSSGVMTLTAPLITGFQLRMLVDFAVDGQGGEVLAVATYAKLLQTDPAYEPNYPFPDALTPDLDESGWALAFTGWMLQRDDGFYFQSDPFDIHMVVGGVLPVDLLGFSIQGTITPATHGGATAADCTSARGPCVGRDKASGTLTTGSASLNGAPIELLATTWVGFGLTPDEVTGRAGLPRACAVDPCSALEAAGGDCQLTTPWQAPKGCPAR